MKFHIVVICFILALTHHAYGQESLFVSEKGTTHNITDTSASKVNGKVTVLFIVEKDGTLSHIKVLESSDRSLNEEAKRIVASMPNKGPVIQDGKAVKRKYKVDVIFKPQ